MVRTKMLGLGLLLAAFTVAGCSQDSGTSDSPNGDAGGGEQAQTHAHGTGPNGGVVFDLGKYHAEFTVDHPANECTILFVTGDGPDAQPLPIAATELTLSTKETATAEGTTVAPMTVTLLPQDAADGKASKFVGTDPGIGNVADFEGTVLGEIDGQPSQGEFQE